MSGGKQRKKPPFRKGVFLAAAVLFLVAAVGGVLAKYVYDATGRNLLSAKEFYFTSNLLKAETGKYVLNSTETEVSFTLGNNADKLRVSQADIAYTVTVSTKNGGAFPEIVDDNAAQVLSGGTVSEATVTLKNLVKGETYVVTAEGNAGYRQTLTAEFTVSGGDEDVRAYLDTADSAYVLLIVWTDNVTGNAQVFFPAGLIPDNTDPVLREVYNYDGSAYVAEEFTDKVNFQKPYSSYTYRFFKATDSTYVVSDFTVSVHSGESIHLIPTN